MSIALQSAEIFLIYINPGSKQDYQERLCIMAGARSFIM